MISQNMIDLLNYRIEQEELSSRLYLAMSQWLDVKGYVHSAKVWHNSYHEEAEHAEWVRKYLMKLDINPLVVALEAISNEFESLPQIINKTYEHEVMVTQQCNDLAKACAEEGDYLTMQLANKFMLEQTEEMERMNVYKDLLDVYDTNDNLSIALLDKAIGKYHG